MNVVRLTPGDCRLLSDRFAEHENSHRQMAGALDDAGEREVLDRLRALRRLECHFRVDLGSLCHRFGRRHDAGMHPLERAVLGYVASWRNQPGGGRELWVRLDRVHGIRDMVEEDAGGGGRSD